MIKDVNGRFDDYSISLKIIQILLHWGYELVKELLQKVKNRYHNCGGKGKDAEYYIANKEVLKENAKNK